MKYIILYDTVQDFVNGEGQEPDGDNMKSKVPGVAYTVEVEKVDYNPLPEKALIFENMTQTAGTIYLKAAGSAPKISLDWSTDNILYTTVSSNETPVADDTLTFTLPAGGRLYLKGNNTRMATSTEKFWHFSGSVDYQLFGDLMCIVADETEMTQDYEFVGLFEWDAHLKKVNNGVLSAPVVSNYGYYDMFNGTGLVEMPSLTANTVGNYGYSYMFRNIQFSTVTELPAMNLGEHCYDNMFRWAGITGMTGTLPATTLAPYCYASMFNNCRNITMAPEIMATNAYPFCFAGMFSECYSLTTPPIMHIQTLTGNGDNNLAIECCEYMFNTCTSLTGTPTFFQNITIVNSWYAFQYMFWNCTNLTHAEDLPATTAQPYAYAGMFRGCTSLTTPPAIGLETLYHDDIQGNHCYEMFRDCTSLTATPQIKVTSLAPGCFCDMFKGCTTITSMSNLPALNLVKNCYSGMFSGCSRLSSVKAMFLEYPIYDQQPTPQVIPSITGWMDGVAANGIFTKNSSATWNNADVVPNGWTVTTANS